MMIFELDIYLVALTILGGLIFLSLIMGISKKSITNILSLSSKGVAIMAINQGHNEFAVIMLLVCSVIDFGILAYRCIKKELDVK